MRGPEERREVPLLVALALLLHAPVMQLRLTYVCSVSVPLLKGEHRYKFGVYITAPPKTSLLGSDAQDACKLGLVMSAEMSLRS